MDVSANQIQLIAAFGSAFAGALVAGAISFFLQRSQFRKQEDFVKAQQVLLAKSEASSSLVTLATICRSYRTKVRLFEDRDELSPIDGPEPFDRLQIIARPSKSDHLVSPLAPADLLFLSECKRFDLLSKALSYSNGFADLLAMLEQLSINAEKSQEQYESTLKRAWEIEAEDAEIEELTNAANASVDSILEFRQEYFTMISRFADEIDELITVIGQEIEGHLGAEVIAPARAILREED